MQHLRRILFVLLATAMVLVGVSGEVLGQAEREVSQQNLNFDHSTTGFILDNAHRQVACESCHTAGTFRGTPRTCATCHSGAGGRAPGKSLKHVPTAAVACDSCHNTTNWTPARMNHGAVTTVPCSTCHSGAYVEANAQGASRTTHVPIANAACETCHTNTSAFAPARMNHAGTAGRCLSCHNGSFVAQNAQAKPSTHPETNAQCDSAGCHSTTSSWFATSFDHSTAVPPVDGRCISCHNGIKARGKLAAHLPTSAQCDSCHGNTISFAGARMNHTGTNAQCSTCHSGTYTAINALAKPATHVATTAQCDTCHQSTVVWAGANFDHATVTPAVAGRCASCHNGTTAPGKAGTHLPTTANCDTCHTGFTAFAPARMNHAGTSGPLAAGNCRTCHTGAYVAINAQVQSATHVADVRQCDTCHASTTTWATATFAHDPNNGNCSGCHNNAPTLGMPSTHIPTAAQCSSCHTNQTAFRPAAMRHDGATTNCSACHNGSFVYANAFAKPATHIPTTAQCSTCHTNTATFSPAAMSHANTVGPAAAGNCRSCHNGSYLVAGAQTTPVSHIPTADSCDKCHGSTAWKPTTFAHTGIVIGGGTCATNCHNGTNALGKAASHVPTTAACDVCHTNFSAFAPTRMNHAGTSGPAAAVNSGTCSTCHSGTYVSINAQIKPTTHISTTAQCDTCHLSTATWATATFNHAATTPPVIGICSSCHNGTTALGKPTTHIPTSAQCDTCHTGGTYSTFRQPNIMNHAGTTGPLAVGNCSSCHGGGYLFANALAKPTTHVATSAQCDTCHTGGYVSWTGARFVHAASAVGTCSTCHNGGSALGKPSAHIPTSAQCDTCHSNYTAFKPASMNHTGSTGLCSTCHGGGYVSANALPKPTTHIPTGAQCDTCHNNGFVSFMPSPMSHTGTNSPAATGNCSTCHGTGAPYLIYNAQQKSATHVATTAQCDTCHRSTTTWAGAAFNHATAAPPVANRCSSCHNNTATGIGKPSTHIPTTAQCDTCHNTFTAFAPATMSHAGTAGPLAAGNCVTCHGGGYVTVNAQIKPATHIPTGVQSCDVCHGTAAWKPTTFAHTGIALGGGTCATCHGSTALGKSASHLATTAACDVCHNNFTSFTPARMNHAGTTGPTAAIGSGSCSTCHSGSLLAINAQIKPATHVATSAQCDTCHSSTTSWATNVNFTHDASAVGRCATCHNGSTALGKPTTHIPTTAQCSTCHNNYNAFRPAVMSHPGTTGPLAVGNCSTCHNGAYLYVNALAKSAIHIPTTGQCDSCHKAGYVAWSPAAMDHTGQTGCSTCHGGGYVTQNAQSKPATHIATTAQCSTCHSSTTSWATATFNHAGVAAGSCATCHNGSSALGKPTNHIPTTATCDTCHKNFTAFNPAAMSHVATSGPIAAANCSTCHNGSYLFANALGKSVNHVVTSAQCDTCHKSTVAWAGASYSHAASAVGTCSTCHNGATAPGKPGTHIPTTAQCDTCHNNYIAFKPASMSHVGNAAQCSTCHNGTYTAANALAKPVSHIPTTSQCDTCHTNGFVSFVPSTMNHASTAGPATAGNCATCHTGTYLAQNAQIKPATHIATTAQCDTCHRSTTTWATATFNHATATPAVTGRCSTCHNGTSALGKPTTHIPTAAQCDTCHNTFTAFAPATMNHAGTSGPVAVGNCLTCHSGTYTSVNARIKPATHIPTAAQCDSCHTTTAWLPTTFAHTGVVAGSCATCHNGTAARGKLASHLPTTAACDVCHTNFTAFAPTTMNHAGSTGPAAAGNCATCHSGTYLAINAQVKPATHVATSAQCDTCHRSTTTWATATFTHDATAVGRCATCHNGTTALGKPTTHIPTTAQCSTCHNNYSAFRPAVMNHAATSGPVAIANCSTCHGGSYIAVNALAKPTAHIPTTSQCDTCHKAGYVAWAPCTMNHTGLSSCTTCHSGAYVSQNALAKPATHIATTAQCSTCHNSTTTWATGTFNHVGVVAGSCATCHNGINALGKPANHIPTTATCDTCHKNFTAFNPATMTHNATVTPPGGCATCHNGAFGGAGAIGKPVTHIPTTQSCNVCHTTSAWRPASFSHTGVSADCASCHNGTTATGKPPVHIPTTQACSVCHRTGIAWMPLITPYTHLVATGCTNCHSVNYPGMDIKPANHLPTTAGCETCHRTTAWTPMILPYGHVGVATGTCQTCHSGVYVGVLGKPSNHIPTTTPAGMPGNECSLCHSSKTTFSTERMNHGTMQTSCATCHDRSSPYLGSMDKITRGSGHHNSAGKDCSSAGCHKPLGSRGSAYTRWN